MPLPSNLPDLAWELSLNAVTAALASFAGAFGAWKISSRADERRRLADEIIASNSAMSLCVSFANSNLALKKQIVGPLLGDYRARFARYAQLVEADTRGMPLPPIELGANLQQVTLPAFPMEDLKDAINGVSHCRSAQPLLAQVAQSARGLEEVTGRRNRIALAVGQIPDAEKDAFYFGVAGAHGCDQNYPDAMSGLEARTNDCIYFPLLLADVLSRHAISLAKQYGPSAPKPAIFQILPEYQSLLPNPTGYPGFEEQYRKMPEAPSREPFWKSHWRYKLRAPIKYAGMVVGILSFLFLLTDHLDWWDGPRGVNDLKAMDAQMSTSYASVKRVYTSNDPAWVPFMRIAREYSAASLPADRQPFAIARFVALASTPGPAPDGSLGEWTAPATPIALLYRPWPNHGSLTRRDYVIVGTIGDLHDWIARDRADFSFMVDSVILGFISLFLAALALLVKDDIP